MVVDDDLNLAEGQTESKNSHGLCGLLKQKERVVPKTNKGQSVESENDNDKKMEGCHAPRRMSGTVDSP